MKRSSNGKIVRTAIAGSIAVHLLIAAFVHAYPANAQPPEKPQPAEIFHIAPPKATPTPPPSVIRHPLHTAQRRPAVRLVHDRPNRKAIARNAAPPEEKPGVPAPLDEPIGPVQPSSVPASPIGVESPSPSPKPACSAPDVPAKAVDAVTPDDPPAARDEGISGMAKIRVDLDDEVNVAGASVFSSTGSAQLDQAALQAARDSRYAPERIDCKDVPGSYLFTVQFQ